MDVLTLAQLGADMRREQNKYFKLKGVAPEVKEQQLHKSKEAEKKFDRAVDKVLNPPLPI